jgi:hypothetical protein
MISLKRHPPLKKDAALPQLIIVPFFAKLWNWQDSKEFAGNGGILI